MIKKVPTSALRVGMFIHELDVSWFDHPFLRTSFRIEDQKTIQKIASVGIREVQIDSKKGRDFLPESENSKPEGVKKSLKERYTRQALTPPQSIEASRSIVGEATAIVRNLMEDARSGKQMDLAKAEPAAEKIVRGVIRFPHALTGVTRIKTADEYTFMHCVSVAALMVTFARELNLSDEIVQQVALGGLIHDIGKTLVPPEILNKAGHLNSDEFEVMRKHVDFSWEILCQEQGLSQAAIDVTMQHHERMDGRGYPKRLKGEQISQIGRMAAIVDVYDALTSVRVYKEAWEPTKALKRILESTPDQFDAELARTFCAQFGDLPGRFNC